MRKLLLPILFILIFTVIGVACGGPASVPTATPPPAKPTTAPTQALDGKALMNERCTVCHTIERIQTAKKSKADWQATVARMKGNGAKLNDAETAALVDFLAATYK
jgi:cytochrome c5